MLGEAWRCRGILALMGQWVVLLRGINVGGKNRLPMAELRAALENVGYSDVRTYIQSGNVVLNSGLRSEARIVESVHAVVQSGFGYDLSVIARKAGDFEREVRSNPFPNAEYENQGKSLHLGFLAAAPKRVDATKLNAAKASSESWECVGKVFYLHSPDGFLKSKLAPKVERMLGVAMTARNWRTVEQIRILLETSN